MRKLLLSAVVALLPSLAFAQNPGGLPNNPAAPQTASSPLLAPYTRAPNPVGHIFGDSRAYQQTIDLTAANAAQSLLTTGWQSYSPIVWANRLTGQRINISLTEGYVGGNGALYKVNIYTSGAGYSAASTFTTSGSGSGATVGTPVVNANGGLVSLPVTAGGSGYSGSGVAIACATNCGTGAGIIGIVGGSGQFGNGGETSQQAYARIPDLEAVAKPGDLVFVDLGVNDPAAGLTLAQSEGFMKQVFDRLLADGYYVIYFKDGPHSATGGLTGTALLNAQRQDLALMKWVDAYARQNTLYNANGYPHLLVIDTQAEATNAATGAPNATWTQDGLHRTQVWGYVTGYKLAVQLRALLGLQPGAYGNEGPLDVYDATYEPFGSLSPNPNMSGTGGSISGSWTGTVASNYQANGSLTGTGGSAAASLETTRTDGLSGQRQVLTVVCPTSGGSDTQTFYLSQPSFVSLTSNVANGDRLVLEADVEPTTVTGLTELYVNGLVFSTDTQTYSFGEGSAAVQTTYPSGVAGISAGAIGGIPGLTAATPLRLRSAPFLATSIGTGTGGGFQQQVSLTLTFGFACAANPGATEVLKISNWRLHKVL